MWRFGQIMLQLENKLTRYGIKLVKVQEYYTSQKCPHCKKNNKPCGRNYICSKCGYEQHRDVVGAINILNDNSIYKIKNILIKYIYKFISFII
jgi:putative transposase